MTIWSSSGASSGGLRADRHSCSPSPHQARSSCTPRAFVVYVDKDNWLTAVWAHAPFFEICSRIQVKFWFNVITTTYVDQIFLSCWQNLCTSHWHVLWRVNVAATFDDVKVTACSLLGSNMCESYICKDRRHSQYYHAWTHAEREKRTSAPFPVEFTKDDFTFRFFLSKIHWSCLSRLWYSHQCIKRQKYHKNRLRFLHAKNCLSFTVYVILPSPETFLGAPMYATTIDTSAGAIRFIISALNDLPPSPTGPHAMCHVPIKP